MAKTKAASETIKGAEHFETAALTGAADLKSGFDKAVKNYDSLVGYGKETVEAVVKSAEAAGKGAETLHNEIYAFSKSSVEETIAATKALMAPTSIAIWSRSSASLVLPIFTFCMPATKCRCAARGCR